MNTVYENITNKECIMEMYENVSLEPGGDELMAETKRPCVMGTGEEETFVRKLQYSLYSLLKKNFKVSKAVHHYLLRIKHS